MVGCLVYIPPLERPTHPFLRWLLSLGYGTFGAWVLCVAGCWVGKACFVHFPIMVTTAEPPVVKERSSNDDEQQHNRSRRR